VAAVNVTLLPLHIVVLGETLILIAGVTIAAREVKYINVQI
jgi:hypothetical protein